MTDLIAFLSTGKGSWAQVSSVINGEDWKKIYLLTNDFGKEKYKPNDKTELIVLDMNLDEEKMRDQIQTALKKKISGDVAVNLISGSGKEHMALLGALTKCGVGIRFVTSTDQGIVEI